MPMEIFSLEFIRWRLNLDEIQFVSRKQKAQFKLKAQVGPFIVNTKATKIEVGNLFRQIKFKLSFSWPFESLGVISSIKIEHKLTPYTHILKSEIEQYANQDVWEENILQEVEENISIQTTLYAPILKKNN